MRTLLRLRQRIGHNYWDEDTTTTGHKCDFSLATGKEMSGLLKIPFDSDGIRTHLLTCYHNGRYDMTLCLSNGSSGYYAVEKLDLLLAVMSTAQKVLQLYYES